MPVTKTQVREYPLQIADRTGLVCTDESELRGVLLSTGALDPLVDAVESMAKNLVADPTTEDGNRQLREMGAKVKKISGALDKLRKGVVDELKEEPKTIDANVREARKRLEALEADVLRPVVEMDARADRLRIYADLPNRVSFAPIDQLRTELEAAQAWDDSANVWLERATEAAQVKRDVAEALQAMVSRKEQEEAEKAELERLRAEKAAAEHKAQIEAARIEGERIARERMERERKAQIEAARIEGERIARERKAREAAEKAAADEAARANLRRAGFAKAEAATTQPQAAMQTATATQAPQQQAYEDLRAVIAGAGFGDLARAIIEAIKAGNIRNITING